MATLRRHSGRILYRKGAAVVGSEDFDIDVRNNGRTIRAYCEMEEGALTRDASWTLDAAHFPVEAHVRVVQNGDLVGSSWYYFTDQETQCESFTADLGRNSQSLPGRPHYVGLHPLVGDGMIALARGTDAPGVFRPIASVTCSYDIKGETALAPLPISIDVAYVGQQDIEVPAGRFVAEHYELRWQPQWPAAKLWVLGDDAVLLRLCWELSGLDSQLVEFGSTDESCSPRFRRPI